MKSIRIIYFSLTTIYQKEKQLNSQHVNIQVIKAGRPLYDKVVSVGFIKEVVFAVRKVMVVGGSTCLVVMLVVSLVAV